MHCLSAAPDLLAVAAGIKKGGERRRRQKRGKGRRKVREAA